MARIQGKIFQYSNIYSCGKISSRLQNIERCVQRMDDFLLAMKIFLPFLLVGLVIAFFIWAGQENRKDYHCPITNLELRKDAKIIDINYNTVGLKGSREIETTVIFDDGFRYVSRQTTRNDHIFSYSIQLTESDLNEIISRAIAKHDDILGQ